MSRSNIGRVLEKIQNGGVSTTGDGVSKDVTTRQRHLEYEDGVIARNVVARDQIRHTSQPFTFDAKQLDSNHLITENDANASTLAVLRNIRNRVNLDSSGLGSTILVTSIGSSEQSTLLARNLAAVLASDDNRTSVLLELQPSRSTLCGDEPAAKGFVDFVDDDEVSVAEVLLPTGVPRMRVIPFGAERVTSYDYLRSTRLRILIKDITRRYPRDRHTVVDAPPIDKVSDVELLNEYADKIILCVPYGQTTLPKMKQALQKIDGSKLLGTVLQGAPGAEVAESDGGA